MVAAGVDESTLDLHSLNWPLIEEVRAKLTLQQRYIRGLFCGGTLCDEAMFLALEKYDDVYSNLRKDAEHKLTGTDPSKAHTFLGYGAHPDPVGVMLPVIRKAKADAAAAGRHLEILAYVLGTQEDSQNFDEQVAKLTEADVTWASSSTNTGLLAREFVWKGDVA